MKKMLLPIRQHACSFIREWFMIPLNRAVVALILLFAASFAAWVASGSKAESVLFFASMSGNSLTGETRALPREPGIEKSAAIIVSELLAGPVNRESKPVFAAGTRLESILYRDRILYIDLSPEAALSMDPPFDLGVKALYKSIQAGIPGFRKIIVTVGGQPQVKAR